MAPRHRLAILALVFTVLCSALATAQTASNASFCELCRDKGNCAQAYRRSPGIYCGAWLSAASQRMACCCPSTGQCDLAASNYECVCASVPAPTPKASSLLSSTTKRIIIAVVVFLGAAMMFALCWHWYQNYYNGPLTRTVVVHQPVYAPPPPAFAAQPYATPVAHAQGGPKFHTAV